MSKSFVSCSWQSLDGERERLFVGFHWGVYFGRDFCIIVIVWESESSVYLCGSKFWHVHTPLS